MGREIVKEILTQVQPYFEEVGGLGFTDSPDERTVVEYCLDKLTEVIEATLEQEYKSSYPNLKEIWVRAYSDCNDEGGADGANVLVGFLFVKEKPYSRAEVILYSNYWSLDEINNNLERLVESLLNGVEDGLIALPAKCIQENYQE